MNEKSNLSKYECALGHLALAIEELESVQAGTDTAAVGQIIEVLSVELRLILRQLIKPTEERLDLETRVKRAQVGTKKAPEQTGSGATEHD